MKKIFFVMGSGRCGTSLVTEAIHKMGVSVSHKLKPADHSNRRGYWEDQTVLEVHKALLNNFGCEGTMGATIPLPSGWEDTPETVRASLQLSEHIASQMKESPSSRLVLKDPRLSVLLPMWLKIADDLGFAVQCILTIRHPGAVAESIRQVSKVSLSIGEAIWLNRVSHVILNAPANLGVIHYESLLKTPEQALLDLASCVTEGPKNIQSAANRSIRVIDRALQTAKTEAVSNSLVESLYNELRAQSGKISSLESARLIAKEYLNTASRLPGWRESIAVLQKRFRAFQRGA